MVKLDENGRLVLAGEQLVSGWNTLQTEQAFLARYPAVALEKTNLSVRLPAFGYTVLANKDPKLAEEGYLSARLRIAQLLKDAGLALSGWLLLDEGAGHAVYAGQKKRGAENGAFGREPVLVFFEAVTGTILVEGAARLTQEGELE